MSRDDRDDRMVHFDEFGVDKHTSYDVEHPLKMLEQKDHLSGLVSSEGGNMDSRSSVLQHDRHEGDTNSGDYEGSVTYEKERNITNAEESDITNEEGSDIVLEEESDITYGEERDVTYEEERAITSTGEEDEFSKRIYILGTGSVGNFVAHSIRSTVDSAPITLLLKHRSDNHTWRESSSSITIESGERIDRQWGFDVEIQEKIEPDAEKGRSGDFLERRAREPPINNLIVCVKAQTTVRALRNVAHRLRPTSTVCFLQNGVGQLDDVVKELFPDPKTRPTLVGGIVSHGLVSHKRFHSLHKGQGSILLSILDYYKSYGTEQEESDENGFISTDENNWIESKSADWSFSARYLLWTLTRARALNATGVSSYEFMFLQLEKVAVNCVINPLTAIYDCKNGELLHNSDLLATMRLLIAEISLVIRNLPELKNQFPAGRDGPTRIGNPGGRGERYNPGDIHHRYSYRFSPETLENAVMNVARQTQDNTSSMLQDVKLGRNTEIEYLNGYIVKRGEEMGVKCVMNYMVWRMVMARRQLEWRRERQLQYEESWKGLSDEVKRALEGRKTIVR